MTAIRMLHQLLDEAGTRWPTQPALVAEDARLSYQELRDESVAIARTLADSGVQRGDRVVLFGRSNAALVATIFAVSRVGGVFVVVAPSVKPFQLRHILEDSEPAVVYASPDLVPTVEATGSRVRIESLDLAHPTPSVRSDLTGLAELGISVDPVALIYTSGSTSMPKAVICTHDNILFAARAINDVLELRQSDVIGCFLPLSFDYGLYQIFLACLSGATTVLGLMGEVGPGLLTRLEASNVSVLPVVPSMALILLRLIGRSPSAIPKLRLMTNTGAHFPASYVEEFRRAMPQMQLFLMFGLTECKRVSILRPDDWSEHPNSVGRPLINTECLIVDGEGEKVPAGSKGELVVRGPHVMAGYWRAPSLTASRFKPVGSGTERALYTGDICSMDEDGFLYFHGRRDGIFKQRGFRVSAAEVEFAALDVDGVSGAALIVDEENGATLVVSTSHSVAYVLEELRSRLDDFKMPTNVVVIDELPVSANGKTDMGALGAMLEVRT